MVKKIKNVTVKEGTELNICFMNEKGDYVTTINIDARVGIKIFYIKDCKVESTSIREYPI